MSYEVWGEPDDGPELPEGWLSEEDAQELRDRITALEAQIATRDASSDAMATLEIGSDGAFDLCPNRSEIRKRKPPTGSVLMYLYATRDAAPSEPLTREQILDLCVEFGHLFINGRDSDVWGLMVHLYGLERAAIAAKGKTS